jgi:hypothetical protein
MEKVKTDGVEYVSDGHDSRGAQGNVWGGTLGGFAGGGIIGYLIGQGVNGGWGRRNCGNNCNNCGNCNNGCGNCGCSENQYVNRFELEQANRAEKLEAALAKEKAERYADSVGINTFKEVVNYFNNNMERRDKVTADLAATVANLDKEAAVNGEKLNCLRDKIAATDEAVVTLSRTTSRDLAACKREVEEWANQRFIQQPKVRLCPGTPTWECASSESLD